MKIEASQGINKIKNYITVVYKILHKEREKIMRYVVYVNDKKKAIFFNQLDALQYKDMLRNINRLAGYKDRYTVKEEKLNIEN